MAAVGSNHHDIEVHLYKNCLDINVVFNFFYFIFLNCSNHLILVIEI